MNALAAYSLSVYLFALSGSDNLSVNHAKDVLTAMSLLP